MLESLMNFLFILGTDIDSNGRLWVLDGGNEICQPKLIIFDLLYFNDEVCLQVIV